jgi:hypothetical protein
MYMDPVYRARARGAATTPRGSRVPLLLGLGALVGAAWTAGCSGGGGSGAGSAPIEVSFQEVGALSGVDAVHTPPATPFTSPMLSGGAAGDFDRDGRQDLFVVMGGTLPDCLFLNNGNGTFREEAAAWGVGYVHVGGGVAVGDYDNDGWLDLFVASHGTAQDLGPGQHRLYHNTGQGSFEEVGAAAGVDWASPFLSDGYGAAFGDYDLDGDLDLFVCSWVAFDKGNRLFRNEGAGRFADVTAAAIPIDLAPVRGFSPRFVDMDGDRDPELLLSGDFQTSRYLINDGDGTFSDGTAAGGLNRESNGMGQAVADFDGDGRLDWVVTSIHSELEPGKSGNMLYLNRGAHVFEELSVVAGTNDGGWGWGVIAVDFDLDGRVDIAETNGWNAPEWLTEQSYLWRNLGVSKGTLTFAEEALARGFVHLDQGRGFVGLDYDDDGDQDFAVFCIGGPLRLYRADTSGAGATWLRVFLSNGRRPNVAPDGYGATVFVKVGGVTQMRPLCGGSNYISQSELSVHFGLGGATRVDELRVAWPNGTDTVLTNVAANQVLRITYP